MRFAGRAALWPIATLLLVVCAGRFAWAHDAPAPTAAAQPAGSNTVTPAGHTEAHLEGPWRFQIGDNPQWADPALDDSSWSAVTLDKPLSELGFESYAGYAWYRIRINARQLQPPGGEPLDLLLTPHSIGQLSVFANGVEVGHSRGFDGSPSMYMSLPLDLSLPAPAADGTILIAVRTWAAPGVQISHGLLDRVELGAHHDIADRLAVAVSQRWDHEIIAQLVLSLLFLFVAAFGAILFFAQRHHSEYLWLALLCVTVAVNGIIQLLWQLAIISHSAYFPMNLWIGRIFMAVTLEFILRFTADSNRRFIRGVQIAFLVFPAFALLGLEQIYEILSVSAEVAFLGLVLWMLFHAWRRGQREAGVMLFPFALAAVADSIDTVLMYMADKRWISDKMANHRFSLGPIQFGISNLSFAIFLASLIAVILYRFVRVSQEEQRSNAEIAAARSVQAMLIPTELPSNKHFMLESAYVPVNGVGGDFFQVLPVEDGSLLIVAGDVSGKGLQAAMNASTLVGAFRNDLSRDPATILQHLNNVLIGAAGSQAARSKDKDAVVSFSTCVCARIYRDGSMDVANAGHLSPYRDGREIELPPGLPLGVIPGMTYEQVRFQLQQGMRVIFLSDGVVEAQNDDGELFGFERTQQVSNESARYIAQTAKRFGQNDDITVISIYIAALESSRTEEEELAPTY
ncbi:PP2C family protein-serine/threonine phosphatase [Occallatibacter riparius]|uniref:SpoIIE family protein phosphatase n=1 Tax=Occallatibacter riparius TaxID=1002689 RepID=A0A9J7BV75_9BACT|nr:SpoIIE family protein phosphatase [Occallatibacter riparius]UWZ85682.1 SpoIIE family protein phosphatase [Occallatibacter riparius]